MIVWSGRGYLSVIVLLITLFICVSIFSTENADYSFIITAFVTGIFSWYFGGKWNTKNELIVIDKKSEQQLKIKNNHTLFWIPMQYCGIIFSTLGIIILFQNSVLFGVITTFILLAFIVIPFIIQKPKSEIKTKTTYSEENKINNSSEIISELKKENSIKKELEPSDHSKFMPK
ncbi:hypothetical protein [Psychroserpens sp. NJDZ02]|uniref:hypothetical protein n=1 Tax=Psychroserpens sp. NJDZ02 TaxID=2570561 RepID=UPI0010A8AEE7|nr:hypothetical protein [Psychroserpens sp. NJDZ02]QCE42066.1 hypothetical protein E9099_11835 [Psychroserpens sp. NJDZ02]